MPSDVQLTGGAAPEPEESIDRARVQLREARSALDRLTGGVPTRTVLAELAQELAGELAEHFDDLPMHRFTGHVPRADGAWGWMVPARRVPHRVVLGRYLASSPPSKRGAAHRSALAQIAVLGLGADGVLRAGWLWESIVLPEGVKTSVDPLAWDDLRLRRSPSRPVRLARWTGGVDPAHVADPGRVLEALTAIAASVAEVAGRDLDLLRRLL
ncbi:MAG: hypothetical protein JO040_05780 [Gemmatimonadetes bacterium]|nr:hypothetical protein [Gemmatimonadota bacterium]